MGAPNGIALSETGAAGFVGADGLEEGAGVGVGLGELEDMLVCKDTLAPVFGTRGVGEVLTAKEVEFVSFFLDFEEG